MTATAVLLGSGTSNGCPSLGYDYPPEFLANPKNWRTRPSLLLRGPEGDFLVDCAPEMRLQLLKENVKDLDGVLITHTHADHIMGMDDLRCFELKSARNMPIYAQPQDQAVLKRVFAYAFGGAQPGVHVPQFELHDVPQVIHRAGLDIETMIVQHGPTPVVAIRVADFAYVTDVNHIPDAAMDRLQNLDVLVLDAVRRRPHPNHYHFTQAIEVAKSLGARLTVFTHLSHDYDHDVTEQTELPPHIRLGYDGMQLPVQFRR